MNKLINRVKSVISEGRELPFSVYSSAHEQQLLHVPIAKPLLVIVLRGDKELGKNNAITCHSGEFIFLSDSPAINIRNIPRDNAYLALLIAFDYEDFKDFSVNSANKIDHFIGEVTDTLKKCLQQFIESTTWAPEELWALRKREILALLYHLGHNDVVSMMGKTKLSHKIHDIFHENNFQELTASMLCDQFGMSESTLRRKLASENTSIQGIKDRAQLGSALHFLQTTDYSIGLIADKCGYQSQSRFTERFKSHFGLTPSVLRKTQLTD